MQPDISIRDRLPALLALAIPVLCGAAWMATNGAPAHYPLVNLGALALACLWIIGGRGPHTALSRHILLGTLLLVLLSPLFIGPELTSITGDRVMRWVPLGSVLLHTGMLVAPALVLLAARNRRYGAGFLLAGILAAMVQPDAATGFALTFAAVGIHHVTKDWKFGAAAILGFFASIAMALNGEIAPQPFVERVLVEATLQSIAVGLALAIALIISFLVILFTIPFAREGRMALAGLLFGFAIMALMSNYPTPFVGYGAASILGFGLAFGLHRIPAR
ncbi:hypothetical protein [Aurantiacibacter marinus]|uniref:Uncharacterized protein n=1 Tax=Aurantiacibacter marinus TaxID=874156 RepID=A0A0H0XNG2_9SPHN|nr:hypothetical protein [Aurantiacibacter marinus]KLI63566.1 hypothetical protein AAV99_07320 [Aurantiacibacter marinus]